MTAAFQGQCSHKAKTSPCSAENPFLKRLLGVHSALLLESNKPNEVTDPMLPTKLTLRDTGSASLNLTKVLHCIHCMHMPRCSFLATDVAEESRGQK